MASTLGKYPAGTVYTTGSPQWSKFVKHGRPRQKLWLNIAADSGVRATVSVRKRSGPVSIVGTCDTSTIKTVKTKLLSVFGTRFSPDLDAETLSV